MTSGKASFWSITINNPTDTDYQQWEALKSETWVREVSGQLEKGEQNGVLHVQGCVKTDYGRHLQQLRRCLPRAHVEVAKNQFALKNYVQKSDTRVAELPTIKVATQQDVQDRVLKELQREGAFKYKWTGCMTECFDDFLQDPKVWLGIRKDWEIWVDSAVSSLIREGYYGVEFVMANPQVRTAFRKYLPDILFRQWKSSRARSAHAREAGATDIGEASADVCLVEEID